MIIAIDFDGTICNSNYPALGEPMPHAIESVRELHQAGHFLILWTCRQGEQLNEALQWCKQNGLSFHAVNDHNPDNLKFFGGVGGNKVYADVYIDDKNIGGFAGWQRAMELIKESEAPKLEWTKNEDFPQDNAVGYAQISESTQMVYFCFNHDFGYGPCWRCFRGELPLEVDPRGVWENDLGEELTENFGLEEEAISFCEEDFKKFMKERR
uniref:Nucleotidase 5'-nucleotidase n=1 Tax=virus sp. ctDJ83 TaxID=2827625 RepID=A0A8S5RIY1_9VIRU|nr:MAG TPA: nucleotidase 5'-nucleotidase [virus sp. ctDJ83]